METKFKYRVVTKSEHNGLKRRARSAQKDGQREVCGLAGVNNSGQIIFFFYKNLSDAECRWEMDLEQLHILSQKMHDAGIRAVGSFHSHPIGEAIPGISDSRRGFFRNCEIIYDVCGDIIRMWRRKVHPTLEGEYLLWEIPVRMEK